jgi:hypothetical protein
VTTLIESGDSGSIAELAISPSGATGIGCVGSDRGCTSVTGMAGAAALAVSPDGRNAYVPGYIDNSLVTLARAVPPARVVVTRTGRGTVKSAPAGLACGTRCSGAFAAGATVTLTARPAKHWRFAGWGGACSGKRATCRLLLQADTRVTARFVSG